MRTRDRGNTIHSCVCTLNEYPPPPPPPPLGRFFEYLKETKKKRSTIERIRTPYVFMMFLPAVYQFFNKKISMLEKSGTNNFTMVTDFKNAYYSLYPESDLYRVCSNNSIHFETMFIGGKFIFIMSNEDIHI